MGPGVKHVFGVLQWFYMLTETILFQNRGLVFYYPPRPPPSLVKRPDFIYGFFSDPFPNSLVFYRLFWKLVIFENSVAALSLLLSFCDADEDPDELRGIR